MAEKKRAADIDAAVAATQERAPSAPPRRRPLSAAEKYQVRAENEGFDPNQATLERLRRSQHTDSNNP